MSTNDCESIATLNALLQLSDELAAHSSVPGNYQLNFLRPLRNLFLDIIKFYWRNLLLNRWNCARGMIREMQRRKPARDILREIFLTFLYIVVLDAIGFKYINDARYVYAHMSLPITMGIFNVVFFNYTHSTLFSCKWHIPITAHFINQLWLRKICWVIDTLQQTIS